MRFDIEKIRKILIYILLGFFTTFINLGVFFLLTKLNIDYKISNIIALLACRIFAYITNKLFVFKTKCQNIPELLREIFKFIFFRGITWCIDFFGLIIAVSILKFDQNYSKLFLMVIVIIINYILSSKFIFSTKNNKGE